MFIIIMKCFSHKILGITKSKTATQIRNANLHRLLSNYVINYDRWTGGWKDGQVDGQTDAHTKGLFRKISGWNFFHRNKSRTADVIRRNGVWNLHAYVLIFSYLQSTSEAGSQPVRG